MSSDDNTFLISIIIPTRERGDCLRESLKTVMAIQSKNLEIIIQDNCSIDSTEVISIKAASEDARVKYFRQPKRVSMRQNFESGVNNSTGDYVIIIGDDDAMLSGQFKRLETLIKELKPAALTWRPLRYTWPGMKGKTGSLTFRPQRIHGATRKISSQKSLFDLHRAIFGDRKTSIYHGCSSRSLLENLKNNEGITFCGYSPDTYFTHATILAATEQTYYIEHPFSINAIGPKSNGGAFNIKARNQEGEPQKTRKMFIEETIKDSVKDVIPDLCSKTLSFPAAIVNTYETAKHNIKGAIEKTDYSKWYTYIFSQTSEHDKEPTYHALQEHAKKTETLEILEEAYKSPTAKIRNNIAQKISKAATKLSENLARAQVLASINGENTVYTAAKTADLILGKDKRKNRYQLLAGTLFRAVVHPLSGHKRSR